jgi:hypothetical protein
MTTTDEESVNSSDAEDQDRRRKEAYKLYKQYAKPTRASMCKIVDYHANDTDITRLDVNLLPWNLEETEVIKEVMKSLKRRRRKPRKTRRRTGKTRRRTGKRKRRSVTNRTAITNARCC